ncbi:MAG: hypothetical protein RLZ61_2656, partial [Planctomycetota bacterium]
AIANPTLNFLPFKLNITPPDEPNKI